MIVNASEILDGWSEGSLFGQSDLPHLSGLGLATLCGLPGMLTMPFMALFAAQHANWHLEQDASENRKAIPMTSLVQHVVYGAHMVPDPLRRAAIRSSERKLES